MIYLAAPYWHNDPAVREKRVQEVTRLTGEFIYLGIPVFSPLTYTKPLIDMGVSMTNDEWLTLMLAHLVKCDRMAIYCLEGWENSAGIRREVELASIASISVYHIHPNDTVRDLPWL